MASILSSVTSCENKCAVVISTFCPVQKSSNGQEPSAIDAHHRLGPANDYRTLYYLGLCSFGLGEYRGAAKSLKKALKINPDDAKSQYQLALTYLQLNKVREARKKLNILYMLDMNMYDSLNYHINNI